MQSVRIWFTKLGRAKYISHLDLMRAMTRAVKRACIPLWYTEGFNPHPYMTFPLPLSVFVESERECMDIKIEGDFSLTQLKESFQGKMPEGLEVTDVALPFHAPCEVAYARYVLYLTFRDEAEAENYTYSALSLINGTDLTAEKKGKQGRRKVMKEICLNPYLFHPEVVRRENEVIIRIDLSAGAQMTVNPNLLLDALNKRICTEPVQKRIVKKCLMVKDFEEFV